MKLSTKILLGFGIVILLSMADSFTNYRLSLKVEENSQFLSKSESVIRNSNIIHKSMIEMQSGFRGYLLTNDQGFLDGYSNGIQKIPIIIEEQKSLISENIKQLILLDSIDKLHHKWINYSSSLIQSKMGSELSVELKKQYEILFETQLKAKVGKNMNDSINILFKKFNDIEYKLRDTRKALLINSISRTHFSSLLFFVLTIIVGIGSTIYIISLITKRISRMVKQAENISNGDFTKIVDIKRDELSGLSNSLNVMSEKLNDNIDELQNRNEELNKFAYVVSHDLKAPVRGIHNVIQWIEEDLGNELSSDMNRFLGIIRQRTQRMEDLINGLLEYARINRKSPLEEIDLSIMVNDIINSIVPRDFEIQIDNLPTLYGERIKLEQIFTNLISNAVAYTPKENGKINVECKEIQNYYLFSVEDNGMGIESTYHDKIFEIFQTLREKDEKESTGIGLSIVKKIIEDQGGIIKVESKLGSGSKFIFTWPINKN